MTIITAYKKPYGLIMHFDIICLKRRKTLCNNKQTNSNSILSTAIPYSYCEPILIVTLCKVFKTHRSI